MSCKTISCVLGAAGFAASAALLAANAVPAQAGGLPEDEGSLKDSGYYEPAPAPLWTGIYVGAHVGYMWADWDGPLSYDDHDPNGNLVFDFSDKEISGDDWMAGLQVGGNYQSGRWVVGAEADISWTGVEGSGRFLPYPDNPGSPAWDIETEITLFGTVRGRLGYLMKPELLLYATGGLAWAEVESDIKPVYSTGYVSASGDAEETHLGYTVGGGLEWMLAENWSIKSEYLYFNLGEEDYAYTGDTKSGATYDTDHYHPELDGHIVRIGLNYKLTGPRKPLGSLK